MIHRQLAAGDVAPAATVLDTAGRQVSLGAFWEGAVTALVFLRHLGWTFCKEQLGELREQRAEFSRRHARLAAVGPADPARTARAEAALRPGFPLLADPSGSAYAAFGLGRGGFAQLFGPAVIARAIGAALRGHLPGAPSGDVLRMPGAFVVGPDGRIRLAHYARHVGDHAPVGLLLRSLPPPAAETSRIPPVNSGAWRAMAGPPVTVSWRRARNRDPGAEA